MILNTEVAHAVFVSLLCFYGNPVLNPLEE